MSDNRKSELRPEHMKLLVDSAITREVIDSSGVRSTPTGLDFPWSDGVCPTVWQARPDKPRTDDSGRPVKYVFPKGSKPPLNRLRDRGDGTGVVIAEGTKQSLAVLSHAPADLAVYGMAGCWGWTNTDLSLAYGRDVFLILDSDLTTNPKVYEATEQLTKRLKTHGARTVQYVTTTGTGKEGVDDVLAGFPEARRPEMLRLWLSQATGKLGRRPKANKPSEGDSKYFKSRSKPVVLQPKDAALDLLAKHPAALTQEGNVALYQDGVYRVDDSAVLAWSVNTFGNFFTPSIHNTINMFLKGLLAGVVLPERATAPLLNCSNGMVDLRTGEMTGHDPKFMSSVQVAVEYQPGLATPVYDAWLREALRRDGATDADVDRLVSDIEETAGTMLDPTKTPSKALFLFGPSRSGKSTFLRLLKAVAGAANTSAVTLHDLERDNFAAANLYNRMLNVAADLSSRHVGDLSLFKMLTGEDVIKGNRKYGQQFEFTNQALIAFSANELPTVSESSRAYAERIKPFEFPNSFAGREDKSLEDKLMSELPGILARWVKAYGRFLARGGYCQSDAATRAKFEASSDRVVQFFQDMCTMTDAAPGQTLSDGEATKRKSVADAFNAWAERNGGSKMGDRTFFERLVNIPGVAVVRLNDKSKSRAFNVTVAPADEDTWGDDEPAADPVEASGVVDAGDPWNAPETPQEAAEEPVIVNPVPMPVEAAEGPQKAAGTTPPAKFVDPFLEHWGLPQLPYEL